VLGGGVTNFLFKISLSVLLISATMPAASAQSRQAQDTAGAIGNLFGALAKAGAKSKAQKGWAQISEPIRACLNTTLEPKKLTVEQLAAAGISPSDERISPLVTSCNQIMAAQLQTNIPCNVTNSKGQQVQSICNQVFAKDENGQIFEVSRDDFLRAAGNGEKVQIAVLELSSANSARLAEEQRLAEAERQAFLASPEGKRQAAAEATRRLEAEKASRQAQAASAARARAAEVAEATRMRLLGAARKSCDAAMEVRHKGNARWTYLESSRSDFFASIYGRNIFLKYAAFYPEMDTISLLCIASPVDGRALRIVNESRVG
jgi:hypothetical protein